MLGLVAGWGIAAASTAGELARLQAALSGAEAQVGSEVARAFLLSWIGPDMVDGMVELHGVPELRAAVVCGARLAQTCTLMGIGFLLYTVLLFARPCVCRRQEHRGTRTSGAAAAQSPNS